MPPPPGGPPRVAGQSTSQDRAPRTEWTRAVDPQPLSFISLLLGSFLQPAQRLDRDQRLPVLARHRHLRRRLVAVDFGLMRQHLDADLNAARIPLANP